LRRLPLRRNSAAGIHHTPIRMIAQLIAAGAISIVNISIHALATTSTIHLGRAMGADTSRSSMFLVRVMIVTVSVLMLAHFCEVCVWALAYSILDVVPAATSASSVYFAFVNYTTLGYGDVLPVERWNLIGPATAMNGILLFGWSTAVIFEILRRAIAASSAGPCAAPRPDRQPAD
jgi:hypothetical protein